MFHQIFNFAMLISIVISLVFFIYKVDQDLSDSQKQYAISYFKAKCFVSLTSIIPRMEATQTVIINNKQSEVKSKDVMRSNAYLKAYNKSISLLVTKFKHSLLVLVISFISIFGLWFYYGMSQKKTDITKGIKLVKPEVLAKQIKKEKIASDIIIGDLPLLKDAETRHILVTGTTGCGKTNLFDIIMPQIRNRKNKAIIIDIKGKYVAKCLEQASR
jgi:ABC-type uncharacterized transport system fused permease/ATPase subunit